MLVQCHYLPLRRECWALCVDSADARRVQCVNRMTFGRRILIESRRRHLVVYKWFSYCLRGYLMINRSKFYNGAIGEHIRGIDH